MTTRRLEQLEVLTVCVLIAALLALVVWLGVDVPNYDEWGLASRFLAAHEHGVGAVRPFEQVNDTRQFDYKLLTVLMTRIAGGWHPLHQMYLNVAVLAGTLVLVVAGIRTLLSPTVERCLLVLAVALIVGSPAHHENLLWGIGLVSLLPLFILFLAQWIERRAGVFGWLAGLLAGAAAAGAYAHGFLVFMFGLPWWRWPVRRERAVAIVAALVAVAGIAALLFTLDLESHGATRDSMRGAPVHAIGPFLSAAATSLVGGIMWPVLYKAGPIIGTTMSTVLLWAARAVGLALVALLGVAVVRLRRVDASTLLPWLLVGLFSLATAAAIGVGRAAEPPAQAFSSRYFSMTMGLAIAALVLAVRARIFPRLLLTLTIVIGVGNAVAGVAVAKSWADVRRAGRDSLTFINACQDMPATLALWPEFDKSIVNRVIDTGLVRVPLAPERPPAMPAVSSPISYAFEATNWLTPSFLKSSPRVVRIDVPAAAGPTLAAIRRDDAFLCLGAARGGEPLLGGYGGVAPGPATLEVWSYDDRWVGVGSAAITLP